MVTYVHQAFVTERCGNPRGHIQGIEFNVDGTKMFRFIEIVRVMLQGLI